MAGDKGPSSVRGIQGSVFLGSEIRLPLARLTELSRMLGAWLGATAEGVGGPVGTEETVKGSQLPGPGFHPEDHHNCGPCNASHPSHVFTQEGRVIEFRKNEFQVRPIYPP